MKFYRQAWEVALHPSARFGQNSVTWLQPIAKEPGKCSLPEWQAVKEMDR